MTRNRSPDHRQDGEEPDSSGWRRVDETAPANDGQATEQGLFVCLPAEELTLEGFAQDGRTDTMAPGPLLAAVLEAITGEDGSGLAALADDQLIGVLSGIRRIEARAAWGQLAVLAELARRRPAAGDSSDRGQYGFSEFAPDEVAGELRLSVPSAVPGAGDDDRAVTCAASLNSPRPCEPRPARYLVPAKLQEPLRIARVVGRRQAEGVQHAVPQSQVLVGAASRQAGRTYDNPGRLDYLVAAELLAGQVDLGSVRQAIPVVHALPAAIAPEYLGHQQLAAQQVMDGHSGDSALSAGGVDRGPVGSIHRVAGVQCPGSPDRDLDVASGEIGHGHDPASRFGRQPGRISSTLMTSVLATVRSRSPARASRRLWVM